MTFTAYDWRTARRAALTAALAMLVACLVAAATDEGGLAWSVRAMRILPLSPGCAALGTWASLARGRARGEVLALAALGRSPWQSSVAAVLGGAAVGVAAALFIAGLAAVDIGAFFPVMPHPSVYRFDGSTFIDDLHQFSVAPDGAIRILGPGTSAPPSAGLPGGARSAVALALACSAFAFPLLAARVGERTIVRTGILFGVTLLGSVLLFHVAAARLVPAIVCPAPSILLLVAAAWSYRAKTWHETRG